MNETYAFIGAEKTAGLVMRCENSGKFNINRLQKCWLSILGRVQHLPERGDFMPQKNSEIKPSVAREESPLPKNRDCPLREALTLIGDKWTALILIDLGNGPRRFTEIERAIDGISRRMLTHCLRNLERHGLVTRAVYLDVPLRVEYSTTPLLDEIRDPLHALATWAERNRHAIVAARRAYDNGH
ncbi:helix-turn-helix domain-containing protein [Streptomyces formicae]|uniref:winged helix-turn-helix transcriptional regulator n=1 Tax=Streptomyces formicae TaxID=1616117 RepID=UPI002D768278|nr:helix-turn-helix domain-containing protein [Streptomyces formicae]